MDEQIQWTLLAVLYTVYTVYSVHCTLPRYSASSYLSPKVSEHPLALTEGTASEFARGGCAVPTELSVQRAGKDFFR